MFVDKTKPKKQNTMSIKQVSIVIKKPNLDLKNKVNLVESV